MLLPRRLFLSTLALTVLALGSIPALAEGAPNGVPNGVDALRKTACDTEVRQHEQDYDSSGLAARRAAWEARARAGAQVAGPALTFVNQLIGTLSKDSQVQASFSKLQADIQTAKETKSPTDWETVADDEDSIGIAINIDSNRSVGYIAATHDDTYVRLHNSGHDYDGSYQSASDQPYCDPGQTLRANTSNPKASTCSKSWYTFSTPAKLRSTSGYALTVFPDNKRGHGLDLVVATYKSQGGSDSAGNGDGTANPNDQTGALVIPIWRLATNQPLTPKEAERLWIPDGETPQTRAEYVHNRASRGCQQSTALANLANDERTTLQDAKNYNAFPDDVSTDTVIGTGKPATAAK